MNGPRIHTTEDDGNVIIFMRPVGLAFSCHGQKAFNVFVRRQPVSREVTAAAFFGNNDQQIRPWD